MIYDADTHWNPPIDYFKNLPPAVIDKLKIKTSPADLQLQWEKIYNSIKDPSWPEPGLIKDFHLLPEHIRRELRDMHSMELVHIAPDLSWMHIDSLTNAYPDFDTQKKSMSCFIKADKQLLNPSLEIVTLAFDEPLDLSVLTMKMYNQAILDSCNSDSRFDGNMYLTLQDLTASMEELENNIDKNFFGIVLQGSAPLPFMPHLMPILEKCQQHNIPITIHHYFYDDPIPPWHIDIDNRHYQNLTSVYPSSQDVIMITVAGFIVNGTLDRLPNLKLLAPEISAQDLKALRTNLIHLGYPDPLPYFKKNFWFTFDIEEPGLFEIVKTFGWTQFLFATDYPHIHDQGGANRYNDVDQINGLLNSGILSKEKYDLLTHKNYMFLKNRHSHSDTTI